MAKIQKKGAKGASKAYITRSKSLKKLQVSLSDFRRLCILKGIFPRVPRHAKRANKGSTAPTTFYYLRDIQYLAHEPVLNKLRQHKTFAKKLTKALGRGEWLAAKGLEESKPQYKLDHIIKERYPTFIDSLKDLDDALSLIVLFSHLPSTGKDNPLPGEKTVGGNLVKPKVLESCERIKNEWLNYVVRTKCLKKVFFSIKGIYFQAEVKGEKITWLVPYLFTQQVPTDVDFRLLSTFLELYQTLLGFVLFRLYNEENLVYPPKFDTSLDEGGAGMGAFRLEDLEKISKNGESSTSISKTNGEEGKKVKVKDVKKQIKAIGKEDISEDDDEEMNDIEDQDQDRVETEEEEFMEIPSKTKAESSNLTTLSSLISNSESNSNTSIFKPYVIYLDRSVPRTLLEFIIKAFGILPNNLGWDVISGGEGSSFDSKDPRITHVIVDRPTISKDLLEPTLKGEDGKKIPVQKRSFVQPQWIADCVNQGKILPTEAYKPGSESLPPHLSPFVNEKEVMEKGGYVPMEARGKLAEELGLEMELEKEDDDDEDDEEEEIQGEEDEEENDSEDQELDEEVKKSKQDSKKSKKVERPALKALLADPKDLTGTLLSAAELEAESLGGEKLLADLEKSHQLALKKQNSNEKVIEKTIGKSKPKTEDQEAKEMATSLMSNKERKLHKKLDYSKKERENERLKLENRRKENEKEMKKKAKIGSSVASVPAPVTATASGKGGKGKKGGSKKA